MSTPEDDLLVLSGHIAEAIRGKGAPDTALDHARAAHLMRAIATDPELEAAVLRRVSRTAALERMAQAFPLLPQGLCERAVDAILARVPGGDPWSP